MNMKAEIYKTILLAPIVLLVLSCGLLATPIPNDSGITGKALVGPMCPVMIEGQECPDQPYQATITVNSLEGRRIVQFQTDEQGNFNVRLAPGEYILHPETPQGRSLPFSGEHTRLIVRYDSGIR